MLLQSSSRPAGAGSRSSTRLAALGLLAAAVLASGIGVRADDPKPQPDKPHVADVVLTVDDLPVIADGNVIVKIVDDEQSDDPKKDEK
jgi:hypothetical protein